MIVLNQWTVYNIIFILDISHFSFLNSGRPLTNKKAWWFFVLNRWFMAIISSLKNLQANFLCNVLQDFVVYLIFFPY